MMKQDDQKKFGDECTKRSARKLDRKQALALAARGLSSGEIAKMQGVARTTVWRFLDRLRPEKQAVSDFKANRADVFARLQARELDLKERILDNLGEDAVFDALSAHQKTSLYHTLTISSGTSYDKERLERGESTQNIGLLTRLLDEAHETLHQEDKKSKAVGGDTELSEAGEPSRGRQGR